MTEVDQLYSYMSHHRNISKEVCQKIHAELYGNKGSNKNKDALINAILEISPTALLYDKMPADNVKKFVQYIGETPLSTKRENIRLLQKYFKKKLSYPSSYSIMYDAADTERQDVDTEDEKKDACQFVHSQRVESTKVKPELITWLVKNVRKNVTHHSSDILSRQRGQDGYSLRPLNRGNSIQVDHIWECQAMGFAIAEATSFRHVLKQIDINSIYSKQALVVQNALKHVLEVQNTKDMNLLATLDIINQKKKSAFTQILKVLKKDKPLERDLEYELLFSLTDREDRVEPFREEDATKISKEIVSQLKHIECPMVHKLRDAPENFYAQSGHNKVNYDELADEVVLLFDKFHISSRA